MPVEIKMVILGKSNDEIELRVNELHLNTRVLSSAVGWNFMHRQLSLVEGQLFNGVCIKCDPLSNNNLVMSSNELQRHRLASIMENSNSNGSKPCVVPIGIVGNKESIHLKVAIAQQIENGVVATLEAVAEQLSFRQPDGKVWVRPNQNLYQIKKYE